MIKIRIIIIALILATFFCVLNSVIYHGTLRTFIFEGSQITQTINDDIGYLEQLLQDEPEQQPLPGAVKVPIIIYHSVRPYRIGESAIQDRFDITPELFEEQLAYLKDHGYTSISLDTLAEYIKTGTTTPMAKPIVLTFDDGWENQYQYAFPLLRKYHMTATFYVYTKPIDMRSRRYLSWDQVKEMDSAGMNFGSHTLSHPFMKNFPFLNMQKEIFVSKKVLEDELKKPVLHFAQPFGYTNPEIEMLIKKAGYITARGTTKGSHHSESDLFHLDGYFASDKFDDFIYILGR